jgi:hypothetical protein
VPPRPDALVVEIDLPLRDDSGLCVYHHRHVLVRPYRVVHEHGRAGTRFEHQMLGHRLRRGRETIRDDDQGGLGLRVPQKEVLLEAVAGRPLREIGRLRGPVRAEHVVTAVPIVNARKRGGRRYKKRRRESYRERPGRDEPWMSPLQANMNHVDILAEVRHSKTLDELDTSRSDLVASFCHPCSKEPRSPTIFNNNETVYLLAMKAREVINQRLRILYTVIISYVTVLVSEVASTGCTTNIPVK